LSTLTAEQVLLDHKRFLTIIDDTFEDERKEKIINMYNHFGDRLLTCPASSIRHFHLAEGGGYIHHVLNVIDFSEKIMELYHTLGGDVEFTDEERIFAAMHHDLGKLGTVDQPYYITNESKWHREHQGKLFIINPKLNYMEVMDRTFFLLQYFNIQYSPNEFYGIRLADGMFEEANKAYFKDFQGTKTMSSNIAYVIHWADYMATRAEVDSLRRSDTAQAEKILNIIDSPPVKNKPPTPHVKTLVELFGE